MCPKIQTGQFDQEKVQMAEREDMSLEKERWIALRLVYKDKEPQSVFIM